eukprot:1699362-Pleurochrysis_carterae.AAC.1
MAILRRKNFCEQRTASVAFLSRKNFCSLRAASMSLPSREAFWIKDATSGSANPTINSCDDPSSPARRDEAP